MYADDVNVLGENQRIGKENSISFRKKLLRRFSICSCFVTRLEEKITA
jgi:hypothetical protein